MGNKFSDIINELCSYSDKQELFDFKENFFEVDRICEYISALSNSAAILGKKYSYFVWGINDKTKKLLVQNLYLLILLEREALTSNILC